LTVDLSGGTWSQDLDASIDGKAGSITLIVPSDVGVRIDADVTLGDVNADGFSRDGDAYVNAAYGTSPVTLRFNIDSTVGEVKLKVAS
jgi:predicted membrane protein